MNDQRVKTDNEAIAEFMGIQVYQDHAEMQAVPIDKLSIWMYADQTKRYETEWKYLMEVVEKIDFLWMQYPVVDWQNDKDQHRFMEVVSMPISSKIEEVHKAVVEFIHWYQKQKSS